MQDLEIFDAVEATIVPLGIHIGASRGEGSHINIISIINRAQMRHEPLMNVADFQSERIINSDYVHPAMSLGSPSALCAGISQLIWTGSFQPFWETRVS